jgi:hypothetical protein
MAKAGKTSSIRYADKSAGQPEMVKIFASLRQIMSMFVKGNFIAKDDLPGNYSIYYNNPVEISGRIYPDLPLAGLLIQKGYVGFYFFPIYTEPELKKKLHPDLIKQLKGKTCFHIKNPDPVVFKQIGDALEEGYKFYKSKGWK